MWRYARSRSHRGVKATVNQATRRYTVRLRVDDFNTTVWAAGNHVESPVTPMSMPSAHSFAPPHFGSNRPPPKLSCAWRQQQGTPAKAPSPRPEGHTDGRLGFRGTTLCSNLAQFYHAPGIPKRPTPVLGRAPERAARKKQIRSYDYTLPHKVNRHNGSVYHAVLSHPQAHEYLSETEFDEYGMVLGPKVRPWGVFECVAPAAHTLVVGGSACVESRVALTQPVAPKLYYRYEVVHACVLVHVCLCLRGAVLSRSVQPYRHMTPDTAPRRAAHTMS